MSSYPSWKRLALSISKKLVVDSSVLIVLNRRRTLEECLREKRDEGYEVLIPKAIVEEVLDEPKRLEKDHQN